MITGAILRDGILSGAHNLSNRRASVDELNVFPVPDGDTGTNMSMTIGAAVAEMGFRTMLAEGAKHVLAGNRPTMYTPTPSTRSCACCCATTNSRTTSPSASRTAVGTNGR